jgi:ParB family chromosome partitioning protein
MNNLSENATIIYIPVNEITAHPNNPRKDLGDLTELSESIRKNGVLQNLTVVPNVGENSGYTAVIGHRRLEASKMAGLEAVPCVISHLTEQEQVRTMLMENMQRSDLTVYEQAQGFQMMMDLGDTAEAIADKTGFSASTVRRRLKLLELDKEKFAAASERGATLMDFAALDGIDDIKTRNKVLEHVGTANFNYELKKTIDKQEDDKRRKRWLELLETFATKTDDRKELRYVKILYGAPDDFTIPEDSREIKYFYKVESWGLTLYREKTEEAPSPEEEARRIAEERRKQLDKRIVEIETRMMELRDEFMENLSNAEAKKRLPSIAEWACQTALHKGFYISDSDYLGVLAISIPDDADDEQEEAIFEELKLKAKDAHGKFFANMVFAAKSSRNLRCHNWDNSHRENVELREMYAYLESLGYEISDEELAMLDGTHEVFNQSESEEQ